MSICHQHQTESGEVECHEQVLGQMDVGAGVCEVVQEAIDVDVCSWVDQGTGVAVDFGVVTFAGEVDENLLIVGFPVDLGIWV